MEKQVNIIIVDDHQLFTDGVSSMLRDCGYKVVATAANVPEGKRILQDIDPDIVICDINMPFQRGTDLIRWLKEHKDGN